MPDNSQRVEVHTPYLIYLFLKYLSPTASPSCPPRPIARSLVAPCICSKAGPQPADPRPPCVSVGVGEPGQHQIRNPLPSPAPREVRTDSAACVSCNRFVHEPPQLSIAMLRRKIGLQGMYPYPRQRAALAWHGRQGRSGSCSSSANVAAAQPHGAALPPLPGRLPLSSTDLLCLMTPTWFLEKLG